MNNKITIIGLGEIGSSFAMAFKEEGDDFDVTGIDLEQSAEKYAETGQWVRRIEHNLFDATESADVIILAIPADQVKKVLELLGHDLKEGAIVMDCCPDKTAAAAWAAQYMEHPENFIGIWAGINPYHLHERSVGGKSAAADMFRKGTLYIAADSKTSEAAILTATGLADTMQMEHAFVELPELDGLIAMTYGLPVLAAYGLMGCIGKQPGWPDGKKAAGKMFSRMTDPLSEKIDEEETGTAFRCNRENTVRMLNEYIEELTAIRDLLGQENDEGLKMLMDDCREVRDKWEEDQLRGHPLTGNTSVSDLQNTTETMKQFFFGGFLRRKIGN